MCWEQYRQILFLRRATHTNLRGSWDQRSRPARRNKPHVRVYPLTRPARGHPRATPGRPQGAGITQRAQRMERNRKDADDSKLRHAKTKERHLELRAGACPNSWCLAQSGGADELAVARRAKCLRAQRHRRCSGRTKLEGGRRCCHRHCEDHRVLAHGFWRAQADSHVLGLRGVHISTRVARQGTARAAIAGHTILSVICSRARNLRWRGGWCLRCVSAHLSALGGLSLSDAFFPATTCICRTGFTASEKG